VWGKRVKCNFNLACKYKLDVFKTPAYANRVQRKGKEK